MKSKRCHALVAAALLLTSPTTMTTLPARAQPWEEVGRCFSGGCDVIWGLNRRFDEGVRSKSEAMVGPVKIAFEELMRELFKKHIKTLISDVDRRVATRIDQAKEVVREAEKGIDDIVEKIASRASGLITQAKTEIIDDAFRQANQLTDKIDAKLHALIEDVDCKIDGSGAKLTQWISSQFDLMPNPLDPCRRKAGFVFATPKSDDYFHLYQIRQCQLHEDLYSAQTVRDVLGAYWNLSLLSRRFRCMSQEPAGQALMTSDSDEYARAFQIWSLAAEVGAPR